MPTGLSTTSARAPSKASAIHGEIATTVSAIAPWKRNSARAAVDLGASCAWTITGTPARRAARTGATSTVLFAITTSTPRRRMIAASRTASGAARAVSSAQRPGEAPQIGRRVGARTIGPSLAKGSRNGPFPTAITSS